MEKMEKVSVLHCCSLPNPREDRPEGIGFLLDSFCPLFWVVSCLAPKL